MPETADVPCSDPAPRLPWTTFTADQQRAALLIDRSVHVAAGAGAGKTAVLAVRYCACLIGGMPLLGDSAAPPCEPERILAVTFTREAAANLRARIDRTLRAVLRARRFPVIGSEGIVEQKLTTETLAHLRRCLAALPGAPLGTADAWCLGLVREHAAELGRDPDLAPPEAVAYAEAEDEAWLRLRREADAGTDVGSALLRCVGTWGEHVVQGVVRSFAEQCAALPAGRVRARGGDPYADALALRRNELADLHAVLAAVAGSQSSVLQPLRTVLRATPSLPSDRSAASAWLRELAEQRVRPGTNFRAADLVRGMQDALDAPHARRDDKRPALTTRIRRASLTALAYSDPRQEAELAALAAAVAVLVPAYRMALDAAAAARGCAGFARTAQDALSVLDARGEAARIAARYRHVLLDEAQDLNPLQGALIERLRTVRRNAPHLFVVGDARQSIYGFRHAEPRIFLDWRTALVASAASVAQGNTDRRGAAAELGENFRSHPDLIAAVQRLCIAPGLRRHIDIAAVRPGRAAGDFAHPAVCAAWRIAPVVAGQELGERRRPDHARAEAQHVVALIRASLARGRRPEDHAILLRARTRMRVFAAALESAGIAYDTDFPGGLHSTQECHDLEAILRLCLDAHDRTALAIALAGPWGVADAHDRRLMVTCLELPPASGFALACAETAIGQAIAAARAQMDAGAGAVLRALARDPRVAARYAGLPLARRRFANVMALADEEAHAGRPLDIAGLVQRWRTCREREQSREEASGERLGSRGVRLMTVHGSKGLEWPVVLVPELDVRFNRRDESAAIIGEAVAVSGEAVAVSGKSVAVSGETVVPGDAVVVPGEGGAAALPSELHLACRPPEKTSVGLRHGLIADALHLRQDAEEARLFYVACTRAAEELHLLAAGAIASSEDRDLPATCRADWVAASELPWQRVSVVVDDPAADADVGGVAPCEVPEPVAASPSSPREASMLAAASPSSPRETQPFAEGPAAVVPIIRTVSELAEQAAQAERRANLASAPTNTDLAAAIAADAAPLPALLPSPLASPASPSGQRTTDPATARALGIALHAALRRHGPGMPSELARAVLAPFVAWLPRERHARFLTRLTDRNLIPGYWSADLRLPEQPVIGHLSGEPGAVFGVCDILLRDADGSWRLYDWKTGANPDEDANKAQVRCYAELVRPHLDGVLRSAGIVDVETGSILSVWTADVG